MNEPKLRFKADDGSQFPDLEEKKLGDITSQYKVRNKKRLPLEIYSVNNIVGFIPQSEQFDDAGYLKDTDTSIYMIVPPKHFAYNPARLDIGSIGYQYLDHDVQVSSLYEVFETSDLVNDEFLWSWFHTHYFNNVVKRLQEGGVRLYFYYDKMQEVKIGLPSLPEQQKIAEFLSTIDTVIEKQKETVSAWEERKKGVMQKLFSQEVRFKADNGSEFPEWENVTVLDLLVQPITDGPHETPVLEENGVSFVSVEAIDNGRVNLTKRRGFISKEYDNVCAKKYKPQLYDVYMVKSGATTGKVAIVTITDDFNIWSPLAAMRTSSKTEAFFLYYQLQSDVIQNQVWTKLSLGNQPNLGMRALELFSAVRPCPAEQQKIADCLSSLDEVIEKQKATLAAWEELKKGLLQQMFV